MSRVQNRIFPVFAEVLDVTNVLTNEQFGAMMRYTLGRYFGAASEEPEPLIRLASDMLINQAARYDNYRAQQRSNRRGHKDNGAPRVTNDDHAQPNDTDCDNSDPGTSPNPNPSPDPINDIVRHAVDLLNDLTGSSYRYNSRKTQHLIAARLRDGYSIDDIDAVIRHQCHKWLGDATMQQYLRPETLFGPKFEGYLCNASRDNAQQRQGYTLAPLEDPFDSALR